MLGYSTFGPSIQCTNQAFEDIKTISRDLGKSIKGNCEDYRQQAIQALSLSFDFHKLFKKAGFGKKNIDMRAVADLDTLVPGIYMLRTKFGHCVFFRCEENLLTVIRVLDSRTPYMVLCEHVLSLDSAP